MQTNPSSVNKNEQSLNVLDLLMYLTSKWKWFLFSVLICGGIAWYQYASSPKVYFGKTTVIIKDPSNKTSTAGLDRYDNFINKVNVANEILQFRSKKLMREVVQRVHADISYQKKSGLHYDELYTQSPVNVSFPDALPEQYLGFTVTIQDSTTVLLSDFIREEEKSEYQVRLNDTLSLRSGNLVITPTNFFSKAWTNVPIKVRKQPLDGVAARYQGNLGIRQEEDESSILTLSLKDNSPKRAEDILNTLINVYNEEAIKDKNQVAINTANFINDRLIIISQELGDVESDLESFKRDNQVVDIASSASMYMSESQKYNADALELETQLRLARYIKEYLTDPKKETDLIPANTGISDMNIETQITAYNATKLKRDRLISDSSDKNPVVEELNNTLHAMKQSIIRAVDNMIVSINVKRNDAQSREQRAQSRVAAIPTKERQMLSIERQQKIKEALYLFLLTAAKKMLCHRPWPTTMPGSLTVQKVPVSRFPRTGTAFFCSVSLSVSPCREPPSSSFCSWIPAFTAARIWRKQSVYPTWVKYRSTSPSRNITTRMHPLSGNRVTTSCRKLSASCVPIWPSSPGKTTLCRSSPSPHSM